MLYVSFSLIVIFITSVVSASVVLWFNHRKMIFIIWSVLVYLVSFWSLGFYFTVSANTPEDALFWGRFHNLVAIMIAPLFLHFSHLVLEQKSKFIPLGYVTSAILLSISLIFIDSFIPSVEQSDPFNYYIRGAALHVVFFFLYSFLSTVGVASLLLALPKTRGFKRKQFYYILCAYALGLGGGATTFPMCYGVDLYPYGLAGVIFYIPLISYTIINHKYLEISIVVSKGVAKVMTFVLLSVAYFFFWQFYESYMNPNNNVVILFNICYLVIACETYQWLNNKVKKIPDNLILKKVYNLSFVSKELSSILINAVEPEQLIKRLDSYFRNRLKFTDFSFVIDARLLQADEVGLIRYGDITTNKESEALDDLRLNFVRKPQPLISAEASKDMKQVLETLKGDIAVPFINEREIMGVLLLKPREGDSHFSSDDYNLFSQMIEQVGSSLSRILAHINITSAVRSLAGSIAHEMRNPLGQLRYSLDTIQGEIPISESSSTVVDKETLEAVFENLAHGQNAVKRGLQIIDMTLDEVKGKVVDPQEFTYLSASELTAKAVDEYCYENERERSKVKIVANEDFYFKGDETMYQFLVFNLLKNALYYFKNDPDGKVEVSLIQGKKYNQIIISDNGPGISRAKLTRLFESFYTSGKKEGTGLGLSYCKRVMDSFGGEISCESIEGKGATFTLHMPKISDKEFERYKEEIIASIRRKLGGKHFLVVDDQQINRMTVGSYFQLIDITIDEAETGLEALNMLKNKTYDGVIMDLSMPVMDGLQAVEKIRAGAAGEKAAELPVIAYTSENVYYASIKCDKVGCDGFIAKSTKMINFIEIVADIMGRYKEMQDVPDCLFENKRVLIADDDSMNRMMIRKLLEEMNIQVLEAHDGNKVLDIFKAISCDLVIMDIQMPGMDGLEAVKNLRQMNNDVSVIALSGYSEEELVNQAMKAGMNDYLIKPVNKKLLYRKLRKYLSNSLTQYDIRVPFLVSDKEGEILDVEHLKSFEHIGAGFIEKFGKMFPENSKVIIQEIEESLKARDLENFERQTHALKGCAANVGARRLYNYCSQANDRAINNKWPADVNWLTGLHDLNEQTEEALKAYILKNRARAQSK